MRCEVLTTNPDFPEIRPKYREGSRNFQCFSHFRQKSQDFIDFEMKKPIFVKKRQTTGRCPGQFSFFQILGGVRCEV